MPAGGSIRPALSFGGLWFEIYANRVTGNSFYVLIQFNINELVIHLDMTA